MRDLDDRLANYGACVIKVATVIPKNVACRHIGSQLVRSGTSVGAHYQEAQGAESRADFVHKLQVALKELRESNYWLQLLAKAEARISDRLAPLIDESTQLRAILSKAVATAKRNNR